MRKEIYLSLVQALQERVPAIKHIDLWNHNVEFIEQEDGWERPAVFIEFAPIEWKVLKGRVEYETRGKLSLHVVTDWKGSSSAGSPLQEESLQVFDLLDDIHRALKDLSGANAFDHLDLIGSSTNHNHEEIVENIETYSYKGYKLLSE